MKKTLLLALVAIIALPLAVSAADRVVVLEMGTGTWCVWCPGAAMGAQDLKELYPGEVLVLRYHGGGGGDPIEYNESVYRLSSFYGISGYPTAWFDGVETHVGGNQTSSIISTYEPIFLARRDIEAPVSIELERTYSAAYHGEGTLTATIINETEAAITGNLHMTITESGIPYEWFVCDTIHSAVRDMVPDQYGVQVTIEPGDTLVETRDFVTFVDWGDTTTNDPLNIELGCFLQALGTGLGTEIYQGALIPLIIPTDADYVRSWLDNADGILHPGETADYLVTILNAGDEAWSSMTGILTSEDAQITIPDDACSWGACEPGEEVTNTDDVFQIRLRTDGDEGHRPMLTLVIGDEYGMEEVIDHQLPEPLAVAEDARGFELSVPTLVTSSTFATLILPRAGSVEMSLVDASGRVVAEIYSGKGTAGLNLIRISSQGLTAGTYFLKVTAADETRVEKLLILN